MQEELNPDEKTLSKLALKLNMLIQNVTEGFQPALRRGGLNATSSEDSEVQNSTIQAPSDSVGLLPSSSAPEVPEIQNPKGHLNLKAPESHPEHHHHHHHHHHKDSEVKPSGDFEVVEDDSEVFSSGLPPESTSSESPPSTTTSESEIQVYDDDIWDYRDME